MSSQEPAGESASADLFLIPTSYILEVYKRFA